MPLIDGKCVTKDDCRKVEMMNKREQVLSVLDNDTKQTYIPAAFFLHFDEIYHRGQAAVDKHLEYFWYTEMDFVKIQYENVFPARPEIKGPDDWTKMPLYEKSFYEDPLNIVDGLVKKAKKEALIIMTLYSPFMCAGHTSDRIVEHIKEDSEKAKKGMEIITDSLMIFVNACIQLGVDGFYHSTQGGERFRFDDNALFNECIKPYDLILMEEINRSCIFNILHICDYHGGYDDLTPFLDYPGHVVNCSLELGTEKLTGKQVSHMFERPYMGGMDRKGTIVSGSKEEIKRAAEAVLNESPDKFILGADCTLPSDISWDNIKTAISTAHMYRN
jgi:uroporphyrinogen decarboxylase